MRHSLLLPALVATVISGITPALAADLDLPPEFRSSTFEIYGGVFGAANTIRSDYAEVGAGGIKGDVDGTGFAYGIRGGFDYVMDGWVVGAVGDWNFGGRVAEDETVNGEVDLRNLGTLRARTGVMLGNSLFYLTGGLAQAEIDLSVQETTPAGIVGSGNYWSTSWTVGGGIDVSITDSLSLGVEYLYVDVKDRTFTLPVPGTPPTTSAVDFDVDTIHTIRVGMNYAFSI